jgi:ABC-type branched-subunit amino acid transport system substrate-binding protein
MKIKQVQLDGKDIAQAVEAFLITKGINLPVHSISKRYSSFDEYEVTFKFEVEEELAANAKEVVDEPAP